MCVRAFSSFFLFFWNRLTIYCTESDVWIYFFCLHHFLKINMKLLNVSCFGVLVGYMGTLLGIVSAPKLLFFGLLNST